MTISDLLTQARAAHRQKIDHAGRVDKHGVVIVQPDYVTAASHARKALRLREQAHAKDPQQTDPAWLSDQSANKGVSSAALCASLRRYLEPSQSRELKSIDEIERAVKVKDGDPRGSKAYALLLLESGWITPNDLPRDLQDSGVFMRLRTGRVSEVVGDGNGPS